MVLWHARVGFLDPTPLTTPLSLSAVAPSEGLQGLLDVAH